MYDVFCNIRDDECEHVRTMKACQEYTDKGIPVISPHDRSTYLNSIDNKLEKREQWKEWATAVNEEGKQD